MDEKTVAAVGAVAAVTLAGQRLRPLAKLAMRGVVAATDTVAGVRRSVTELYAEAREEQRKGSPPVSDAHA